MRKALLVFALSSAFAQDKPITRGHVASETANPPEFLQVKLGKTLAEQFPECKTFVIGTPEFQKWDFHDPPGFRCAYLDHIFDHNFAFSEAGEEHDFKSAIAYTQNDGDTGIVGYVGTSYSMDSFKETLLAVKAKRGQPTSCTTTGVQNMMGAHFKQIHCEWKQPWGVIALTAPSDDDLTLFDIWAMTTRHIQLRKQERLENQKKNSKDF